MAAALDHEEHHLRRALWIARTCSRRRRRTGPAWRLDVGHGLAHEFGEELRPSWPVSKTRKDLMRAGSYSKDGLRRLTGGTVVKQLPTAQGHATARMQPWA